MRFSFAVFLQSTFVVVLCLLALGVLFPAGRRALAEVRGKQERMYRGEIAGASRNIRHNLLVGDYPELKLTMRNLVEREGVRRVALRVHGRPEGLCVDRDGECADTSRDGVFSVTQPLYFDEEGRVPLGSLTASYERGALDVLARRLRAAAALGAGALFLLFWATNALLARLIRGQVLWLLEAFDALLSGRDFKPQAAVFSEQDSIQAAVRQMQTMLADYRLKFEAASRQEAELRVSKQVAHDIRSPLAALDAASQGLSGLPDGSRALLLSAIGRIRNIADDLTERGHAEKAGVAPTMLQTALMPLVLEKQALLRGQTGVSIRLVAAAGIAPVALVVPEGLSRIVSNLINNALEAVGGAGDVTVEIRDGDGTASVSISDSGPGIPPDILPKLGQRGATFGKEGGTGLGLWHARTTVESWGGSLEIESELGKGTTIRLILPGVEPPATPGATAVILVDDDPLARMNWTLSAKKAGKVLKAYADPESLIKEASSIPKDTPIYIDSDLGDGLKGEDAAKELSALGFTELHLATGHDPASFPALPFIKSIRGKEPPWAAA